LLKEEKYQEALDKWGEVRAVDPKYPDRQWVGRTAKRKLGGAGQSKVKIQPQLSTQQFSIVWLILLAAIGFGLARLVELNLARAFRVYIPGEVTWGVVGALQGLIAALVLGSMEREWKWKSLPIFGLCWAVVYPMVLWAFRERAMLLIASIVFALAPAVSIVLASLWARQVRQWQIYILIFIGWILAWVIGLSLADYINPVLHGSSLRWVFRDILAGGIGLWITINLLGKKSEEDAFKPDAISAPGSTSLLIWVFLSIIILRAIWGLLQDWSHVWDVEAPTISQVISLFMLGGFYGTVVALSLKKVVPNWKVQHSVMVIIGWALGLGTAILVGQVNLEFITGVMALCGISVSAAIVWANPSVSPIKILSIFLCWALTWKYGNLMGGYLRDSLYTDYTWCFVDATTVLLGLLATLGIYGYSSKRLATLTFIS
jgi:hypothetical protein